MFNPHFHCLWFPANIIRVLRRGNEICTGLEEQIYLIAKELSVKLEVEVWYSGESILNDLQNGKQLDLIFLDIELVRKYSEFRQGILSILPVWTKKSDL